MTTTVDQKGSILWRWAKHRAARGMPHDVKAQCSFNWPSMPSDEVSLVVKAYQRREKMAKNDERPAAPSRLAKHVVYCELGHRRYVENFTSPDAARAFIDLVIGREKVKWKSTTTITAKDGVLIVTSALLEELMDMKKKAVELPSPIPENVEMFLHGQWPKKVKGGTIEGDKGHEDNAGPRDGRKKKMVVGRADSDTVTLGEICEKHGWEPRSVRIALRREKWKKPEGGWQWPTDSGIEKKLQKLIG